MRSEVSELVKKMREVGAEMNHGNWDVVCLRMLIREIQRAAVDGGCGPLWLGSGGWRSGGVKSVSGRTVESNMSALCCGILRAYVGLTVEQRM